ncbi:hypothetical protein QAD02_000062 [Eretmocerus hayati]|uniref:Uncharacterized protein n=1 Tax=Eretmocerus hayati TaxID=131215 RepID=A0ACC2NCW7_9HYME|nr:hypothetical protein QAD02_000062 [Eretmocerus hayati]
MDQDFKELANDESITNHLTQFTKAVDDIQEALKFIEDPEIYDKLSNSQKIQFNLLMSFGLNGLFWMYLRSEGLDPTNHQLKNENERLKQSMVRAKQIHDRNTRMPRLNRDAAQRFIRSSLWVPVDRAEDANENPANQSGENWDKES